MLFTSLELGMLIGMGSAVVVSLVCIIALFVPRLGRRIYRSFWPQLAQGTPSQHALRVSLVSSLIAVLTISSPFPLRAAARYTCTAQDALRTVALSAPLIGMGLLLLSLPFSRRAATPPAPPSLPASRRSFSWLRFGGLSLLVLCSFGLPVMYLQYLVARPSHDFERVAMVSATEGWAIGNEVFGGMMYHYAANTWTPVALPPSRQLMDIAMVSPEEGWVVTNGATMLHYQDGAWQSVPVPARQLTAITMLSAESGWAVGNFGAIVRYSDGQWRSVPSPVTQPLESISMVSETEGWAVGGGDYFDRTPSVMLHYRAGVWRIAPNPTHLPLTRVHMLSSTEGWAVGGTRFPPTASVILHFRDGIWGVAANPTPIPLSDIAFSSPTEGWAVGGGYFRVPFDCPSADETVQISTLLRYEQGVWREVARPVDEALRGIALHSADTGWIVGWNRLMQYDRGTWHNRSYNAQ